MHSTAPPQPPIRAPALARPRSPLPFRSPIALHSYPPTPTQESSAPRRGVMSSGAAQLPNHRGGKCRHRGAVMGCRAPQTLQPERRLAPLSRHRRRRGRPGCPDAGHAVRCCVRVRCPPCGRTSVQLVGPMSGVQGDRCPHHRRDPGVRTDRRPVSAPAAAALSAPRWIRNASVRPGPATVGAPGSTWRCGR